MILTRLRRVGAVAGPILLALGAWCCQAPEPAPRLLVLGIDGMDAQLLERLMAADRMPHFQALARRGGYARLQTTTPPQSPVAWATFITGLDPEGHGIYDFLHRRPEELTPFLSTSAKGASGQMERLVRGTPFWDILGESGIPSTLFKVPSNFPPGGGTEGLLFGLYTDACPVRAFAGMGTPDILGTYGTFTYYTEGPYQVPEYLENGGQPLPPGGELEVPGGRVLSVHLENGRAQLPILGPELGGETFGAAAEIFLDREHETAEIVVGPHRLLLRVGEWSAWVRIDYGRQSYHLAHLTGIARYYLKAAAPHLQLYMTPVNIDPASPAMPVSAPAGAADELQQATGLYYTQGMPDDTKALDAGVFDYDDFLAQAALTRAERRRQMHYELDRFEEGLLFFYVHSIDQVSHMLWSASQPSHPGYRPALAPYGRAIEDLYLEMDELLGEALGNLDENATVVVMSDHGFAPFERAFNLNAWLAREGYLSISLAVPLEEAHLLMDGDVLWEQTRAYGLGLNALYLNLRGRERRGMVDQSERDALLDELERGLLALRDPEDGRPVVREVHRPDRSRADQPALTPDLLIGYARGYRASGETAIGQLGAAVLKDNLSPWSGDHCMAAEEVPGILLSSVPLAPGQHHLRDLPVSVLAFYGVAWPAAMSGHAVWAEGAF